MPSRRHTLLPAFAAGLLALLVGCGSKEEPKKTNPDDLAKLFPTPVEPPKDPVPPVIPPKDPVPPVIPPRKDPVPPVVPTEPPPRPMTPPAPLPPDEPSGPGPMVVVPPPVNPPPVGPDPVNPPAQPADPAKPVKYPELVAGRKLSEWLEEATKHKDPQYREAAVKVLPMFGPDVRKQIIRPLCFLISDQYEDASVRTAAMNIVANLGFDFRINDNTATPDQKLKMAELRKESKEVINALRQVMANTGNGSLLRQYAVQALATFGADAHPAVGIAPTQPGTIRAMASDHNWVTRHAVAQTLASVGVPAEKEGKPDKDASPFAPATDILLNILLKDKCAAVRVQAVQSLLILGPPKAKTPAEYITQIAKFLEPLNARIEPPKGGTKILEEDPGVLVWMWLLQLVYDDRTEKANIAKIAGQVKEPKEPGVRLQALYALGALRERAMPAMPTLRDALAQYEDPLVLMAAMSAVAGMGTKGGADALPELTALKNGKRDEKRPDNAPKDWKPDPTLRYMAEDVIAVVTGKKKLADAVKEPTKDDPEPKK